MADSFVVRFLILLWPLLAGASSLDTAHSRWELGERDMGPYTERYLPLIKFDPYLGQMAFKDEIYFQDYFQNYLFPQEGELGPFLKSELNAGLICSNELLSEHFEEIRYAYRLVTLSYLIEAQSHMRSMSEHLRLKNVCPFDTASWAKTCSPKGQSMKSFLSQLSNHKPFFDDKFPESYTRSHWWKEWSSGKMSHYSQYRMKSDCRGCSESDIPRVFKSICDSNKSTMDIICNEEDEILGLSKERDAYYLLGLSNIINPMNKRGEALGCLRRFSEVMARREVHYKALNQLFPPIQGDLRQRFKERFLQGRVFFYGSGKEFEEKGLKDLYVKEQSFTVKPLNKVEEPAEPVAKPQIKHEEVKTAEAPKPPPQPVLKKEIVEIPKPVKSALLMASEVRGAQDLERVDVDMLKLKYDYVFSLHMMNTLSEKLKVFMTREALKEMMSYDKLGTKDGPVPILFIKFMIDYQEHQGLWNMLSVLGDKFYVSNEIDTFYRPGAELIQLVNNASTGGQWQIYVLRP